MVGQIEEPKQWLWDADFLLCEDQYAALQSR